jgi:ABC-2 type transport system ATP-binding protein
MSLEVQQLTKVYGQQKAVNNVSFSVREGEIVGFLGPNGAGKSTTMKIATTYIPPTAGSIRVGGFDVQNEPLKARRVTGYLPEHNPLYLDMYVREYLQFAARIAGLSSSRTKERVNEMIVLCGLALEQNKKIESLSKGYRQRVGLAQALIHDPNVLILDEPTSGLDPNQLVEIRKLIKTVSKDKTVIFSTHIMQEVKALCDRVVVINKGEIVANDSLDSLLKNQQGHIIFLAEFEGEVLLADLKSIEGVLNADQVDKSKFKLTAKEGIDIRPTIFRFAADKQLSLIGLKQEESSLEAIFKELTTSTV